MGIKLLRRLSILLFILSGFGADGWAVEIKGRSSTQVYWFNDYYNGRQVELAQYLRIAATNIDKDGKFSIYGYGRAGTVLGNADSEENRTSGRLYYLYGAYRDIGGKLDVQVGRQFNYLSAESSLIDGARLDLKNVGPIGFTFLAGRNVAFDLTGELSHRGDYATGAAIYLQGFPNTDVDISWFRKFDEYDLARDILGASFKQYLFQNMKLYGNARYDLVSEVFSELLGGLRYFPTANLSLTAEYYQSYPTFDTTSIYSVFAVNRYKEALVRGDYSVTEKLSVYGGFTRQDFGDADGEGNVYIVGITLRPLTALTIDIDYDRREGYGGTLNGGTLEVNFDATPALRLAAGAAYDVYQRDSMTGEATARNYWVGARYKLTKKMSASLRIEESSNKTYSSNSQGRFVFDYDF